jgi:heme oxygenase
VVAARIPLATLPRLEEATRADHAQADADRFRVLDDATGDGYRRFLATVYRFEYAFERALAAVDSLSCRFVAMRMKTGQLGDDLLALGFDPAMRTILSRPVEPVRLPTAIDALGWLYVIDRNTLRHAELIRGLAPRIRCPLRSASRYLTAYGSHVYERWHELGAYLDHCVRTPAQLDLLVLAAMDAFARQRRWYAAVTDAAAAARSGGRSS